MTYINPDIVLLVPDLQTINLVLKKHGDGTKVGMGTDSSSQLLISVGWLGWVVKQPHGSNSAIQETRKVGLFEIKRQGKHPHQVRCQLESGVVILHAVALEIGQVITESLRPLVGTTVKLLVDEVRVSLGNIITNVEPLLQLRLGSLLEDLRPQHLVSSVPSGLILGYLVFLSLWQGEELLGASKGLLLLLQRHRVSSDLEEAIVEAALADLVHNRLLAGGIF